jgi:hypothetical protein
MCLECKHILRDAAAGFTADEVPLDEARANFMDAFRGHYRPVDAETVYARRACRKCGRFRARHDTGCCEWCGRPWRKFPAKRSKKKPTHPIGEPTMAAVVNPSAARQRSAAVGSSSTDGTIPGGAL